MQVGNWRYLSLREARLTFLFWFKEVGYSLGIYWIAFATLLSIIFPPPPLSKPRRLELRIRGEEREGRERGEGGRGRRVSCNTTFSVQVRRGVRRSSTLCSGEDWRPPPLSGLASPPPHYQLLGRGAPTLGWSSSFSSLSHLSSSLSLAIYFTDPLAEIL